MTPFEFLTQGDSPIFAYNPSGNRIMKTYFQDSLRTYTAFHQMPDALNAFGMVMPERSFSNEKYRYGFNGKETDQETQWQDYGFRIYYPNISRFISPDPLIIDAGEYPELSTYQFASNTPIQAIDIDGLEGGRINNEDNKLIGGGGTNNSQSNGSRFTQTNTTGRTRATNTPGKVKTVQANTTKAQVKKINQADLQRGRNNEALTIENEKLTKNNKTYTVEDSKTGKFTNVKPDANDPHQISEIKDVKKLSNTSQIRAERQLAKDQGKDFKIYTGTDTKVSKTIPPCELITRDYLGPQNTLSNPVLE